MSTDLILFDLDNTLLSGDSDHSWAQFLIETGVLDGASYAARNDAFYAQYKAGTLNIYEFLEFQLAPLAQHPRNRLDEWHARFMREKILPVITPAARALVAGHLADGSLCAVVTATNNYRKESQFRTLNAVKDDITVGVVRSGVSVNIGVKDLVVGDVVRLNAGDRVPCDGVLVDGSDVTCNESALTGESDDKKKGPEGDVFMLSGATLSTGFARVLATAVGEQSRSVILLFGSYILL